MGLVGWTVDIVSTNKLRQSVSGGLGNPGWEAGGAYYEHTLTVFRAADPTARAKAPLWPLPQRPDQTFTERYLSLTAERCKPRREGCDQALLSEHEAAVKSGAYDL